MQADNSTAPFQRYNDIDGLSYSLALSLGIIVLILTILLFSYLFVRSRHGTPITNAIQLRVNAARRGTVPQDGVAIGIDEAALDSSCPRMIYSEKSCPPLKSGDSDQETDQEDMKSCCSICLSDYKDSEVLRVIPDCGHMFHAVCIDQWLRTHATCPVCRTCPQNLATLLPQQTPTPIPPPIPASVRLELQLQAILSYQI